MTPGIFNGSQRNSTFPMRTLLALCLIVTHAVLVAISDRLPDSVAALVAATVYLPLWPFSAVGLDVYGQAESGGWSSPNLLSWCILALLWSLFWLFVAFLLVRPRKSQRAPGI